MASKVATIRQEIVIPASPEEVFEAFVDAAKHTAFTGSKATGQAKVGAKFTAWDGYISGKHLELQKGKRILQEWTTTDFPKGQAPSTLELAFEKVKEGTRILMVHSGVPAGQVDDIRQGWTDFYWDPLKQYFQK